ncbi:MAG: peroxidase-related enzyme [Pseudomonadales bacterium]|nr:peroxidase-related enzyme [Pseudomonadales bacterium]
MSILPSLGNNPVVLDVLKKFPATVRPLLEFHEILMRGSSPLTPAEMELIAAYVSSLNGCYYCTGAHTATAEHLGVEKGLVEKLKEDIESSGVDEKMKPLLRYVRKLTTDPTGMEAIDAEAVFAAGWNEQALHDAVQVCCLFNFMNRFIEGLGIKGDPKYFDLAGKRMAQHGYRGLMDLLGIPHDNL